MCNIRNDAVKTLYLSFVQKLQSGVIKTLFLSMLAQTSDTVLCW